MIFLFKDIDNFILQDTEDIDDVSAEQGERWLLLTGIILIPLPLIGFLLSGISWGGLKVAEIIGFYFSKLLVNKTYLLTLLTVSFITTIGDITEQIKDWNIEKQIIRTLLIFKPIEFKPLITIIYIFSKALIGAWLANFLGYQVNKWFGLPFDPNSLLFISSLSAIGAYLGLPKEQPWKFIRALIGAWIANFLGYQVNKWLGLPFDPNSLLFISSLSIFGAYRLPDAYFIIGFIEAWLAILLGYFLNKLFELPFDSNSLLFISSLSAIGAYGLSNNEAWKFSKTFIRVWIAILLGYFLNKLFRHLQNIIIDKN